MPKVQMCLTVSQEIQRFAWQGQIVARPTPRVLRNDADVLYELLAGLDHSKERFRDHRRTIAALCRLLRPVRKKAQGLESECEDEVIGTIEVSDEALRFVGKLFDDPPEGATFAGTVETALMIDDALDDLKKKDEPAALEAAAPKPLTE